MAQGPGVAAASAGSSLGPLPGISAAWCLVLSGATDRLQQLLSQQGRRVIPIMAPL